MSCEKRRAAKFARRFSCIVMQERRALWQKTNKFPAASVELSLSRVPTASRMTACFGGVISPVPENAPPNTSGKRQNAAKRRVDMNINAKVRLKNPVFITQLILAVFTPVLSYAGLTARDITTWNALWDLITSALRNPYILGLVAMSVWNAVNDPTTSGISDSLTALTYRKPKKQ